MFVSHFILGRLGNDQRQSQRIMQKVVVRLQKPLLYHMSASAGLMSRSKKILFVSSNETLPLPYQIFNVQVYTSRYVRFISYQFNANKSGSPIIHSQTNHIPSHPNPVTYLTINRVYPLTKRRIKRSSLMHVLCTSLHDEGCTCDIKAQQKPTFGAKITRIDYRCQISGYQAHDYS